MNTNNFENRSIFDGMILKIKSVTLLFSMDYGVDNINFIYTYFIAV